MIGAPHHQLVLETMGRRSWRLRDLSAPDTDAATVIAYVELEDTGRYHATWVLSGGGVRRYSDMSALMADADARVQRRAVPTSTKPQQIPHRPPMASR